jgi:hypothetical protein
MAVVEPYVQKNAIAYMIALGNYAAYQTKGIPHAVLVDPKGKITWSGHPAELSKGTIEESLKGALEPGGLGPGLSSVAKLLRSDQYGKAHAEAKKLLGGTTLKPESRTQAEELCALLERTCAELVDAGLKACAEQDWATAGDTLGEAKKYAGLPRSEEAIAKLTELQANPAAVKELQASARLKEAEALERARDFDKAHKAYGSLATAFAGTTSAEAAQARRQAIEEAGKLGFDKECRGCSQLDAACPKHAKRKKK